MSGRAGPRRASLAARWLASSGLSYEEVRRALTQGLAGARSPLGGLRWRLEHALPDGPPEVLSAPRPEPRVVRMRECEGRPTQPRLFTPTDSGERRCRDCRTAPPAPPTPPGAGSGYERFRAARRAACPAGA
ncbi:hypothetical protein LHJ74_28755 [Streptomyces sp. N2-109]|uniref:Uncharacterized protein n=1 Tax=Streptomyces gossypii TaxID=2883101 RepID=A0ABT2K109_9ACTN|nr:hypothetical protein [Streptomyces gossypii]MCT2593850.1 hypothetical protein [Streptomyces gossypii]